MKNRSQQMWPGPVFDYLAGRLPPSELISYVTDTGQETEANFLGLKLRSDGATAN